MHRRHFWCELGGSGAQLKQNTCMGKWRSSSLGAAAARSSDPGGLSAGGSVWEGDKREKSMVKRLIAWPGVGADPAGSEGSGGTLTVCRLPKRSRGCGGAVEVTKGGRGGVGEHWEVQGGERVGMQTTWN